MTHMGWVRAKGCESGACVEVMPDRGYVGVRNSRVPAEIVWFDAEEWAVFRDGVKAGDFDHVDPGRPLN